MDDGHEPSYGCLAQRNMPDPLAGSFDFLDAGCFGKETRNTGLCYGRWVYVAVQQDCRQWLVDAFSIGYQLFSQGFLCDGVCASLVLFSGWPCTAVFEKKAQKERRENWT